MTTPIFGQGGWFSAPFTLAGAVVRSLLVSAVATDGADVTQGTTTDAATGSGAATSVIGALRAIRDKLLGSLAVTGTFWQTTQPVKGTGFSIPVTLTVTNGAYTVGHVVGGLITLPNMVSANGKHAIIYSVTLAGVVAIPYELWLMTADIATPAADTAAFTLVAADTALVRGIVPIYASDYFATKANFNVASVRNVGLQVQAGAATTSILAYLKATAVTPPGTTTLYLRVSGEMID